MRITEFSATERRSLAILAMAIDDVAPDHRDDALLVMEMSAKLDDVSIVAITDGVNVLALEKRRRELVEYLRSGGALTDVKREAIIDAATAEA
ncbi:MAG TPA: hypothetical protein VLC46_20400 [Thermoanaerobaculia bacterium]|nr:hypothetical protein [Thermoanaerobaculia bacterium]